MSEPSNAVQKAIYQALTVGSPSPVSATVYDHVPQKTDYPYVVIDAQETVEDDHLTEQLDERFIYLSSVVPPARAEGSEHAHGPY